MKRETKSAVRGFTFIEMIVVSAVVGFLALTIYSALGNGIRVWQRLQQPLALEDAEIFTDKFASELKNCFEFKGISFSGTRNSLAFATLVVSPRLNAKTVGRAVYGYDSGRKTFSREIFDFSDIFSGQEGFSRQVLVNVKSCEFKYYTFSPADKKYLWSDEWAASESLPLAVKMELEIGDGTQGKVIKYVFIPSASVS